MTALSEPERLVRDTLSWASDYQPGRAPNLDDRARDLVAALRPLLAADPSDPSDPSGLCTTCRDCGLCCAYGHLRCWLHADDGGDRELRDQLCPPADPEIVTGEQARELPDGSLLIKCTTDGEPYVDHTAFRLDESARRSIQSWTTTQSYRVLHRAPAPAPKVGDVVRTEAELDRLPVGAVVRCSSAGVVAIRQDRGWFVTGYAPGVAGTLEHDLPARVLDLGVGS